MNNLREVPHYPDADRSAEILARIRPTFAEKGFDGASMQDLARAAGMSVGNFYRYFPSKDAIIAAMAAFDMAQMQGDFAVIHASSDPLGALRAAIAERMASGVCDDGRLWAEITAAGQRKPEVARIAQGVEELAAANFIEVIARVSGLPQAECALRFGAEVRFIVMLFKAAAIRRVAAADPAIDALVMRTIDATLNDILSTARN